MNPRIPKIKWMDAVNNTINQIISKDVKINL